VGQSRRQVFLAHAHDADTCAATTRGARDWHMRVPKGRHGTGFGALDPESRIVSVWTGSGCARAQSTTDIRYAVID
jgi:hypothetical protein